MASAEIVNSQTFWSTTAFKVKKLRYLWTICNFSFCPLTTGEVMKSPIFAAKEGPRWQLSLYPRGETQPTQDKVSLFLNPYSVGPDGKTRWTFKFKFIFMNSKEKSLRICEDKHSMWDFRTFQGRGYTNIMSREKLIRSLRDDKLVICCEILISDGCESQTSGQADKTDDSPVPDCTLSTDLERAFKDQKCGDLVIEVGGEEFSVYRGILQSRSPVFASMFARGLEETQQNRLVIKDAEPSVIEEMLTYVYTGRSPNIETKAKDLLPIAEKYHFDQWKVMCENALTRTLTRDNAIETLISADFYRANLLRKNVISYIVFEKAHFLADGVWSYVLKSLSGKPDVMMELGKELCLSGK